MLNYTFDEIPTFDDTFADVQRRYHMSGAMIADILYGATDKEGNPTYPKNNADGHGRLIVIELDGKYHALAWKHSRTEGGKIEEGSDFNNALAPLEEDIRKKREVLKSAREVMSGRIYDTEEADKILAGFGEISEFNTPKEIELKNQYDSLVQRNDKNKNYFAEIKQNADKKNELLAKARELGDSEEWNETSEAFGNLLAEWKKIGNAGEDNDKLWEEFTAVRQAFFDKKKKHFEDLDQNRKASRQIKRDLIKEAKRVAIESPDYNATHKKLEGLFEQWKKAGHAGKDENVLWSEFKAVRDEFYNRREEAFKERLSEKEALVKEAQSLADAGDYSNYVSNRMKELNTEWKNTGFCGKEGDKLWESFHAAQDKFWQGKKAQNAERMNDRKEKLHEAIDRRREKIAHIEENNKKLRDRLTFTSVEEKKAQIEGWIAENIEKIKALKAEIDSMDPEKKEAAKAEAKPETVTEEAKAEVTEETAAEEPAEAEVTAAEEPVEAVAEKAAEETSETAAEEATEAAAEAVAEETSEAAAAAEETVEAAAEEPAEPADATGADEE